jgi:hypothetical protein
MLSPADLLEIARAFIDRIPRESAYHEERDVCLLLLGKGYLRLGDDQSAARVLPEFSRLHPAGELRVLLTKWALVHPESAAARDVLRDTVENIVEWESAFSLRDYCEMVPSIYSLMGEQVLRRFVDSVVGDAYMKSALVHEWLRLCANREVRLALQAEYEGLAKQVDLDLASIGETAQALDVQSALDRAKEALKQAEAILQEPPRPVDTPANSLSRYLHYRQNDLKVRWLVDQAALGGVDEWTLELQIEGDAFQCVERARQPNPHTSVSRFDGVRFAAFLFDRPIPLNRADEDLLSEYRSEDWDSDPAHVVQLATEFFRNFGVAARQFSEEQVNQGIWMLFGYVLSLGEILEKTDVRLDLRTECLKSMIVPFRDFYQTVDHELTGFYMWWDYVSPSSPDLIGVARTVLSQILDLPSWECQKAALHGLNHLRPDIEASAIVDRYLQQNSESIPPDELEWVKACRDGKAL